MIMPIAQLPVLMEIKRTTSIVVVRIANHYTRVTNSICIIITIIISLLQFTAGHHMGLILSNLSSSHMKARRKIAGNK